MTRRHTREIVFLIIMVFALFLAFYPVLLGFINRTHVGSAIELQLNH